MLRDERPLIRTSRPSQRRRGPSPTSYPAPTTTAPARPRARASPQRRGAGWAARPSRGRGTVPGVNRRARLELVTPAASPEEAAAVIAAVERFLRDTAPPPAPPADRPSAWARAARLEGVGLAPDAPEPWGRPPGWGG